MTKLTKRQIEAASIFGSMGGRAKAKKMTQKERSENMRKVARARWDKKKVVPVIHI